MIEKPNNILYWSVLQQTDSRDITESSNDKKYRVINITQTKIVKEIN